MTLERRARASLRKVTQQRPRLQVVREFQAFYDDSFFGILHVDAEGEATYANAAWAAITGLHEEQSLGKGWMQAVHAGDRVRALDEWRQAVSAATQPELSFRVIRPDGARRYVRVKTRPVPSGTADSPGFIWVVIDVTDGFLAERRLRRNNELLSAILENIPCGVTVFDAQGRLVLENQNGRAMVFVPDHIPMSGISDFGALGADQPPAPADPDSDHEWLPPADFNPAPRVREEIQPDGRVLELRDAPMPTGGIVTTYTDITQHTEMIQTLQEAKAAAEQAGAAKAAFLAAMSHEIRTPMNGVMGMVNVLMETRLTRDQREILDVIWQSGESLLVVINDILDYSKIESGQMELEWLPFQLEDVIDSTLRLLRGKAHEKNLSMVTRLATDLPALVLGDRTRLQQVLMNLVSNAVKFTEKGEVRINVSCASGDGPCPRANVTGDVCTLNVTVQDTGIGIPGAKLESIFEPFVQADSSTARRYGGTGLGLSIARRLVQAMGGSIQIESEHGAGTRVSFSFLAEVAAPRSRAAAGGPASLSGQCVLLVSGARVDVGVLERQLKRWGMDCRTCLEPSAALSMLQGAQRFDVVLAAADQGDTCGLGWVAQMRAAGISIPAVLLSRRKLPAALDPALCAWMVPRSASESRLYDTLVQAIGSRQRKQAEAAPPMPQFDPALSDRAPLRILVAEDNEINRMVALRTLSGFGYQADVAQNGAEVVDAVRRHRYDLVLMDIHMPEVDGIEATRFIVNELAPDQRPRVVAMSASVMPEDVQAAVAAGAAEYIPKPFSPAQLRAALERATGSRQPPQTDSDQSESRQSVLSLDRLQYLLQADPSTEFLQGLVTAFASASDDLQSRLGAALRTGDAVMTRSLLHEYSGMCAVIGAQKLMQLTQELHQAAKGEDSQDAEALLARCTIVRQETVAALANFLSEPAIQRAVDSSSGS